MGIKRTNFYCYNVCGGGFDFQENGEFSIDKWNGISKELDELETPESDQNEILFPGMCSEQCFKCMAIVGETRIKNKDK